MYACVTYIYTRRGADNIYELSIVRSSYPLCSNVLCILIVSKTVDTAKGFSKQQQKQFHMLLTNAHQSTRGDSIYCQRQ